MFDAPNNWGPNGPQQPFQPGGSGPPADGMMGPQGPGAYQQTPPPPPPIITDLPLDEEIIQSATVYLKDFFRTSSDYVRMKERRMEKFRALVMGEIGLWEWAHWRTHPVIYGVNQLPRTKISDENEHRTDYVEPIGPYIHTEASSIFNQIFSGPEWFQIFPESEVQGFTAPDDQPIAKKLKELLKQALKKGGVEGQTFKALTEWATFGTLCAKVWWEKKTIRRMMTDPMTGQTQIYDDLVVEYPVIQAIPMNMWLPDSIANHTDVQRWRGLGHRVIRSYDETLTKFDTGEYELNRDEFIKRFKNGGGAMGPMSLATKLDHDPESTFVQNRVALVQIWEYHGSIPTKYGLIEAWATWITHTGDAVGQDGVLVRLKTSPLCENGLRPFVLSHYIEQPGPYGKGMVELNEPLLFMVSQFTGQMQDLARYMAEGGRMFKEGTCVEDWVKKHKRFGPGCMVPFENKGDIESIPGPDANINVILQCRNDLSFELERNTSVSNSFAGVQGKRQTATEASLLNQQSEGPASARAVRFASEIIDKGWGMALAMLQQFTCRDQQIVIRTQGGQPETIQISQDEIRRGRWGLQCSLTNQATTSIAQAQSIERSMNIAPQYKQALAQEGTNLSLTELFTRYIECLQIGNSDMLLRPFSTQEQMLMQQNQQMGQIIQQLQAQLQQAQQGQQQDRQEPGEGGQDPRMNSEQRQPTPVGSNGGPNGSAPTDQNAQQLRLQMQAMMQQGGDPNGKV